MSTPSPTLLRTALYEEHRSAGARLVDFHGWEMPLRYSTIPREHEKVRLSAGIFDLGHMGRLELGGEEAQAVLDELVTANVRAIKPGSARYALFLNTNATILEDSIVYRLPQSLFVVVNAGNRESIRAWIESRCDRRAVQLVDRTLEWAMVAVQGPHAARILPTLFDHPQKPWEKLRYYQIMSATFEGHPTWVARTGYTGEDGFEVYLPAEDAPVLWDQVLDVGKNRVSPVGLGARDTLRLEAGMPLYGQEIDETVNPYEARLDFAVKLDKAPFVGKDRLEVLRKEGVARRLCGFRVASRRVARQGMRIYQGDRDVGYVTSGAPSPTLGCPIAMGYVNVDAEKAARAGSPGLTVDLRGQREPLEIESLPFYSRVRKKSD